MRFRRTSGQVGLGAALAAAAAGAWVLFGSAGVAQAQVNGGVELGLSYRSSEPKLKPGLAVGAHLEFKVVPAFSFGAYYLQSDNNIDKTGIDSPMSFRVFGGRARAWLPIPNSSFKPYGFVGVGYTWMTSTPELVVQGMVPGSPTKREERDGHFLEIPIGLGLAYQVVKFAQLHTDFAIRPGVSFGGAAYDGPNAYDQPKIGFTWMTGGSLDF